MGLWLYAPLLELGLPIPAEIQIGDAGGDQHDREEHDHEERLSQREPPRAGVEDGLAHNWNRGEHELQGQAKNKNEMKGLAREYLSGHELISSRAFFRDGWR